MEVGGHVLTTFGLLGATPTCLMIMFGEVVVGMSAQLQTLFYPAGLEFFYAQSPHKMRGMMIGLFFFAWGVASAVSQGLITAFGFATSVTPVTCDFWYYLLYLLVVLVGVVGYLVLARAYKNRQRGERESDVFYRQQ